MMASRYSVRQSSSVAGLAAGKTARTASSPRISQPAFARSSRMGTPCDCQDGAVDQQRFRRAANAGAPHLGVQHDGARLFEIGLLMDIDVANAFEMREHRHARFAPSRAPTRPLPPRGMMSRSRRSSLPASCRPRRGRWSARAGSQLRAGRPRASLRPSPRGWRAEECADSDPPRRIAALPDFRHSAPASAVTLGRLS